MNKAFQRYFLATLAISPLLGIDSASAQNIVTTPDIAEQITVRIEGATQGSGVLVKRTKNTYTVLTAWHVLSPNRPGEDIDIITNRRTTYTSSIKNVSRIGNVDLAIINFTSNSHYSTAEIAKDTINAKNKIIYVSGHPISKGLDSIQTAGSLIANADVSIDQGYQLIYTNSTEAGMSGGPIFNSDGKLIGIHGRGEVNQSKQANRTGITKTNINLGIPIYFYQQFSRGLPISSLSQEASTWDDYYALFTSLNARAQISAEQENNYDTIPTELKFLSKMIDTRPNHSLGYILTCSIETQGSWQEFQNNETCQQGLRLVKKYKTLVDEAWQAVENNDPQSTLDKLNNANEYLSSIGAENFMLRARITAGIGDPLEAVNIATAGISVSEELLAKNIPLVTTRKLEGFDENDFNNFVLGGLYFARGQAYNKLGEYNLATLDLNKALQLEMDDKMRDIVPPEDRYVDEASIYIQLAFAKMIETRNKRLFCKIYIRADYLNSISKSPAKDYGLKNVCDEFYSDKSLQPKAHTREGMDNLSQGLCSTLSLSDENGNLKIGESLTRALKQSRYPIDHVQDYIYVIKTDSDMYSTFKSDESLSAWAMTIVYNSSKLCPDSWVPHLAPDEDMNWNGIWNQYMPQK